LFYFGGDIMGLIYKISNSINEKIYIGKTCRSLETRWKEHLKDKDNCLKNHNKLYKAMNKYGIENFKIEVLEDNLLDEELGQKEREYIKLYDSYYNGYNCTFGGEGEGIVDIEKLKKLYFEGKSYLEISELSGHTEKTVSQRLRAEGLYSKYNHKGYLNKGKPIIFNNETFDSLTLLAKFLQTNIDVFKEKEITTIIKGISKNAKIGKPYCGYMFYYK
jgi:group I intron endonuclease